MARPRRRTRQGVSLFPFLSVLACVTGALTLILTATAIGQLASDAVDVDQYEGLQHEIAEGRRQLASLQALGAEVEQLAADVGDAGASARALEAERQQAREQARASAGLRRQLGESDSRVATLRGQLEPLTRQVSERRHELVARRKAAAVAPILLQPSGSGRDLEPHFVECRAEGIVLYEGGRRRATPVSMQRLGQSAALQGFLRAVRERRGATVVFLVRPGGVGSYQLASLIARQLGVRNGKIPLPGSGALDFSRLGAP